MRMRVLASTVALTLAFGSTLSAQEGLHNHVTVQSKTVCTGQKGVDVRVLIENAVDIRHVTVPLVVRSGKGDAFVTTIRQSWGDRLPTAKGGPLSEKFMGIAQQIGIALLVALMVLVTYNDLFRIFG